MTHPECERCDYFSGCLTESYLVCAVHPTGPAQDACPDFTEVIEAWEALGGTYENGELIKDWAGYLSTVERSEVLESHPYFTGVCPQCSAKHGNSRPVHYDCACGWMDDSIN